MIIILKIISYTISSKLYTKSNIKRSKMILS